jgi:sugar phosphate isomerase/epimerase
MFVVGMRGHDVGKLPFAEFIKRMKELNVGNIQFAPTKAVSDMEFGYGKFSPGLAAYMGEEFRKNNIRVSVFGSYLGPIEPDEAERKNVIQQYVENLKYAKFIGADMVGTETPGAERYATHEEAYAVVLQSFREIVGAAQKLGVMFAAEGVSHHAINSPKTMRRLLDDINSPNLCVIFDPINVINGEDLTRPNDVVDEMFKLCGNEIMAIHLKDFRLVDGKKEIVPIGQGVFDFERFFAWLKKNKPYINMMIEGSAYETFTKEYEFLKKAYK